jgi:hypothetical protein
MAWSRVKLVLGAAALLGAAAPSGAQVPNVTFAFPPGGQAGTKATVNLNGANLQGATQILVAGEGVEAKIANNSNAASLPVELTIGPDVVPGPRELRVVTPRGTSNAERVWIGTYPEVNETEPNNTVTASQKLEKLPVTLNGQVNGGEDVDTFTFQAAEGDTYVFDLVAYRMASALDGYLSLYDGKGKIIRSTLEAYDRDPRIIYTFKQAGTYSIQVRDTTYRGGGDYVYKLTVGKVPVVTGFLPLGGKRGETVNVSLQGVNLGDMKTMSVPVPMEGTEVSFAPKTPMGMVSSPIRLMASDLTDAIEAEPNDTAAQATPVAAVPVVLNGIIDKPADVDLYRIKPAAAGNFGFEVVGRRIGSRIDSYLRVLDAMGKPLQENDDAAGRDSRIVMGLQANTEYLVEVRSTDRLYGGDFFYRLEIRPPATQDFTMTTTPDNVNVGQGGSAVVTVNVSRIAGFSAPIALRVEGLPEGVTASPASVPTGASVAQFTLTAAPGANPGALGKLRVIGTATINNAPVERVAQPIEKYSPPMTDPNQAVNRNVEFHVATVMPAQAYALDVEQKVVSVKKGTMNVEIKVKVTRQMGVTQQINLTVAGQPANVAPVLANIEANKDEAVIKLNVAANAPEVTQNLIISGNLNNNVQVAPAVQLTITP